MAGVLGLADEILAAAALRDGTMDIEPSGSRQEGTMVNVNTVQVMTRRTGGVGAYGWYLEGRAADGAVLRAFLAAEVLGTSTLAPGAKGARWVLEAHLGGAQAAQSALTGFFGSVEPHAVAVELTGQDVGRLRRSVLTSAVYPLADLLSKVEDNDWTEVS